MSAKSDKPKKISIKPVTKKKPQSLRSSISEDEKFLGSEPNWDTERALALDNKEFDRLLMKSLNYYNYFFSVKDLKKYVIAWLEDHSDVTAADIAVYKTAPDSDTPITVCSLLKAQSVGMPLKEPHKQYILNAVARVINSASQKEPVTETKVTTGYKPTIQDRMREKVSIVIGEIDHQIDLVTHNKVPELNVYEHLTASTVPYAFLGKVSSTIAGYKNELVEAASGSCDQLTESYSFLSKKDIKRIVAYLDSIQADLDTYGNLKKTLKKARVKKPVNKEKLVSKMKYMKEFPALKIASISPVSIIGSVELWCYNTKTRKLGVYVADSAFGVLGVKGTTITGYDPMKSVSKTLRKPDETLRELQKAGKVQLRTFMKNIKAIETKLTGRIADEVVLLKVQ